MSGHHHSLSRRHFLPFDFVISSSQQVISLVDLPLHFVSVCNIKLAIDHDIRNEYLYKSLDIVVIVKGMRFTRNVLGALRSILVCANDRHKPR